MLFHRNLPPSNLAKSFSAPWPVFAKLLRGQFTYRCRPPFEVFSTTATLWAFSRRFPSAPMFSNKFTLLFSIHIIIYNSVSVLF